MLKNITPNEKIRAEMTDYLRELNSLGKIDYSLYREILKFSIGLLDKMHEVEKPKISEDIAKGKKVNYKYECVSLCPPDCGTPEDDKYDYVPHCPSCDSELSDFPHVNYCSKCGQKVEY